MWPKRHLLSPFALTLTSTPCSTKQMGNKAKNKAPTVTVTERCKSTKQKQHKNINIVRAAQQLMANQLLSTAGFEERLRNKTKFKRAFAQLRATVCRHCLTLSDFAFAFAPNLLFTVVEVNNVVGLVAKLLPAVAAKCCCESRTVSVSARNV